MRKNSKGTPIDELFNHVLCLLFDSTSRHLAHFEALAKYNGDAAASPYGEPSSASLRDEDSRDGK